MILRLLYELFSFLQEYIINIKDFLIDIGVNIIFAFIGVVFALKYENLGAPKLFLSTINSQNSPVNKLKIVSPTKNVKQSPASEFIDKDVYFLHIKVRNSPLKKAYVTRQTAYSIHGSISFHLDGKQIGKNMPIRWCSAPQPIKTELINGMPVGIVEPNLIRISNYMDIPPDEEEAFAVAFRYIDQDDAYGFTSTSYYFSDYCNNDYKLNKGEYVARIKLFTGDICVEREFKFSNLGKSQIFDFQERG